MAHMPETIILRKTGETKTAVEYSIVEPKTNADRIRAMSDDELAEFMSKFCNCDYGSCPIMFAGNRIYCIHGCETAWNEWLKKEVEE